MTIKSAPNAPGLSHGAPRSNSHRPKTYQPNLKSIVRIPSKNDLRRCHQTMSHFPIDVCGLSKRRQHASAFCLQRFGPHSCLALCAPDGAHLFKHCCRHEVKQRCRQRVTLTYPALKRKTISGGARLRLDMCVHITIQASQSPPPLSAARSDCSNADNNAS